MRGATATTITIRHTSATTEPMRAARSAETGLPWRPRGRVIRAAPLDLWGTPFLDGPASDDRYKRPRLVGIQGALAGAGIPVAAGQLVRAFDTVGHWLGL